MGWPRVADVAGIDGARGLLYCERLQVLAPLGNGKCRLFVTFESRSNLCATTPDVPEPKLPRVVRALCVPLF